MPLSEILAVDAVTKVTGAEAQQHWFQIRTANVDFFVGDDSQVKSDIRYIDNAILRHSVFINRNLFGQISTFYMVKYCQIIIKPANVDFFVNDDSQV
jgi:hypothetical protein